MASLAQLCSDAYLGEPGSSKGKEKAVTARVGANLPAIQKLNAQGTGNRVRREWRGPTAIARGFSRLLTNSHPTGFGRNEKAQRAGNRVRRGKRPAPGTARAEHVMDDGFCVFPI